MVSLRFREFLCRNTSIAANQRRPEESEQRQSRQVWGETFELGEGMSGGNRSFYHCSWSGGHEECGESSVQTSDHGDLWPWEWTGPSNSSQGVRCAGGREGVEGSVFTSLGYYGKNCRGFCLKSATE